MKRTAFTMIELIFVIVILGILAAVAIPKLASVQDDAVIATEKAVIGAARSGVSILRGKRITRGADFNITITDLQGTDHNLSVVTSSSNQPNFLSVSSYTPGTAAALTLESGAVTQNSAAPRALAVVVEMDGIVEWEAAASTAVGTDANQTIFTGPAGRNVNDVNAEIHSGLTTQWTYNNKTGAFRKPQ